ncbi:MAG: hypothetical protein J0651_03745 [Actinobacteria bacterium]|nr:hypothetical protein [Actinomycetota bacterium]
MSGDTRTNPLDCPFEAKEMQEFKHVLALDWLLSLLTIVGTALIWRSYWKDAEIMLEQTEISIEDYV